MNVVLNKKKCQVRFEEYADNSNVALLVVKPKRGKKAEELVATATVNTDMVIKSDFVAIKGWSENVGMEQALIEADVICPKPVGAIPCGMAVAYVYELTTNAKEARNNQE
ncbi:hypothetical protein [Enterococcus gallinarum]|uniref:hypothetical protein n=1 Tax=Enterococcus gallinarum TaxID=1353 RepID=UPI002497025A|nr:hypothetical protein [Enterococcus gallinarum]GMG59871.1 hypothetical protein AH4_32260 [Enterococcus gallinarum]